MKTNPSLFFVCSVILLAESAVTKTRAVAQAVSPVVYVGVDSSSGQPLGQLRVINSDGTGDRVIPVNLPEPGFPSFSKNGRFLALTSQDPGRPFKQSRNVFLFDLLTGQAQQITLYEDIVTPDNFAFVLPWYHALAPDLSRIAVWQFVRVRNGTTPLLRIHRVADGFLQELVVINRVRTGNTQGGDGVDWHPTQNLLVYTVDTDVPTVGGTVPSEGAALFISPPVEDAFGAGAARRLTFPRGYYQADLGGIVWSAESDYAPAFSPNGQQVAYVRALWTVAGFGRVASVLSLRVVNLDGSNDHEILRFPAAVYVTHVSWSPGGTHLVFDAGQQALVNGTLANFVVPQSDELYIVNTDGSGLRRLRNAAAGFPVWAPARASFCSVPRVPVAGSGAQSFGAIDDCPPPIITGLQPSSIPVGSETFELIVNGGGFAFGAVVRWNNQPLPTLFVSPAQVRAQVLAQLVANPGSAEVIVVNAATSGLISNSSFFSIESSTLPIRLRAERIGGGTIRLRISGGAPTATLNVQASEDLADWQTIATLANNGNGVSFDDAGQSSRSHRFYRVEAVGN